MSASAAGEWPLIGRASELSRIAEARAARASGVVVTAGAGVGKSRLGRAALTQAERDRAVTVWVQATRSAASVPLGAFAGVIPMEVRSDDQFELLRGSAAALTELAGTRPLVVGVDDAQLLDSTSAALVLHLASAGGCFVLATVRTGEPCPDAIVSLWKDAGAQRLELAQLGERETAELVESIVGGPVEEGVRRWAWGTSKGNALYVRELVLGALDGGALREVSGLWRMVRRPALSTSLAEVVSARLAGLGDGERRVLELLALGEPLGVGELVELADEEPAARVETHGLITIQRAERAGEVRLSHPLYGETIRAELGTLRAAELRLALARRVQARGELTAGDSLRVTRWLLDAHAEIPDALLLDAAGAANVSGDPDLGAELAERALTASGGIAAALLLARANVIRRRFDLAEHVLAGVESALKTQDEAFEYLEQRTTILYWGLKQPEDAQALLDRAQDWWSDRAWQRRLVPLRLHIAYEVERSTGTLESLEEVLSDDALDEGVRHRMGPIHAATLFYGGRVVEAHELIRRIRPSVPLSRHSEELGLIVWSMVAIESGQDLGELEQEMAATFDAGVRAGDRAAAGIGALTLGGVAFLGGRYRDARRWVAEAEIHFEQQDVFGDLLVARSVQVGVACSTGDFQSTAAALASCEDALEGEEPLPTQLPYLARARAWAAEAMGDRARAQHVLRETAALMSSSTPVYAAALEYDALRAGAPPRESATALAALGERCDGRLVAAYADHAAALAERDGSALLAVADEFERIGALRYGTEAAAQAAEAFLAAGREDSARRGAARCRELYVDGQGGIMPVVEGLDRAAVELTAREAQLVELARQGLSNPEIAERLVLSVRTVESHLYRAMQKLGVSDRRQL